MTNRRLLFLALVAIATVGLPLGKAQNRSAAAPDGHPHTQDHYAELATVPEKARIKRNPMKNDPDAAAAGGKLFEQHCAECHGAKATGTKRGPSLLKQPVEEATPGALFWILTNGVVRRGMPDWSKLPEPQRWQLVSFIKSLGGASRKTEPDLPEKSAPSAPHTARDSSLRPR